MSKRINAARGATINGLSTRFNDPAREADGDWLDSAEEDDLPSSRTEISYETPRTAITRNTSPDLSFDRSINAYRGCEHGCVYCFARPTHAYLGLSPGLDFERKLTVKRNIPALLRKELENPRYACRPIALGTNTDPYQPVEGTYATTRKILEILSETNHPVMITTKSARVVRDIDILASMAERGLVAVMVSVTTLDPETARTLEPRATAPHRRIAAVKALAEARVPVSVSLAPLIPAINDHEIEALLEAAAKAGATMASMIMVRLPHEVAPIFRAWLDATMPDRAARVMTHIRAMRGGKDNDGDFHTRFKPQGAYAAMIRTRFQAGCRRYGLVRRDIPLRTDLFSPRGKQFSLF
ncbi:PA0069 family radical SAM protein [Sphingosinicella soli]|uniref:DNA repair photolyase n=1 Tax=Sphingosinicella soli TaxID=333708 RepID=A0A7W7F4S9_9SPHN|nr:PA0069 family radical SAM protein [Sphingosinicella soli]MBB4630591.1 DNA repair photolyase [Sphingosinicella soli]